MGKLRRILLRYRLHPEGRALAIRGPQAGGLLLPLGSGCAARIHDQLRRRRELNSTRASLRMAGTRPGHFIFTRECEVTRASSLNDNLDLVARPQPVLLSEAVKRPESFERVIGCCHAVCKFLDSIVWPDGHDFQTERPDLLTFLQSHAAKAHDRFAKREIDRRRSRLGGEDESVNFAAEAHGVQAK